MPGYIPKALKKLQNTPPKRPQHSPYKHTPIQYRKKVQYTDIDISKPLNKEQIKKIQQSVSLILYYTRAVDSTLSASLSTIATEQAAGTVETKQACWQMLNYCYTHPDATLRFLASNMILTLHSNVSYLSEKKSHSRAAGHFYLIKKDDKEYNNGAILTLSMIIKHVVALASEVEMAALFYNTREAVPLRVTLEEMGHKQPATTIVTDNNTAHGLTKAP
eukprot:7328406-Ditylum_brightwellii.AAC.1